MNIKTTTAVLAFLLAAAPARAGELSPAPIVARVIPAGGVDIKIGGILQTWYQAQRRGPTGFLVKNARVYFVVEPSSWVALNIMPAFMSATGMTLLNAFVDVKPVDHLSLRMGQFVTPFGQNRMMPPGDLEIANFHSTSRIWPGFASDLGWDVGAQAATSWKYVEARAAVINGTGPNVTKDTDTAKDLTARVDFSPSATGRPSPALLIITAPATATGPSPRWSRTSAPGMAATRSAFSSTTAASCWPRSSAAPTISACGRFRAAGSSTACATGRP